MILLGYLAFSFFALIALAGMIIRVARHISRCPDVGSRAVSAGISIAAGFVSLGGGAALLLAALLAMGETVPMASFCGGALLVVLGLGFTHAMALLRQIAKPQVASSTVPANVVLEPVLA